MPGKKERLIVELYEDDPERADAVVFGRRTDATRRGFLGGAGLAAMGAAVGGPIVFGDRMPAGLMPAAFAQEKKDAAPPRPRRRDRSSCSSRARTRRLVVLGDQPLVAETPEHLLDDETTPTAKFYIRNNGLIPEATKDPDAWKIAVDGEVNNQLELTLGELKKRFTPVTRRMVLECGGNGRSFFTPQARGNQWTNGGAGCAEWTGVRVADVLKAAGVKPSGRVQRPLRRRPAPVGRRLAPGPVARRADEEADGREQPDRLGDERPAAAAGARLSRCACSSRDGRGRSRRSGSRASGLRDKVHDGQGMGGTSYRVTVKPMVPGGKPDPTNFRDLESMPVRSIVTSPANGARLPAGAREVALRGAAWAGDHTVRAVDVSVDYGSSWRSASLGQPTNPYDWQRWTATVRLPSDGYYEVWTRATDQRGVVQPHIAGNWNPQGYGANPMHRIAILVG